MPWKIVERKIGRAGGEKQRHARQREWDRQYGADQWAVGCMIDATFTLHEDALESVYDRSYESHFAEHSADPGQSHVRKCRDLRGYGTRKAEFRPVFDPSMT